MFDCRVVLVGESFVSITLLFPRSSSTKRTVSGFLRDDFFFIVFYYEAFVERYIVVGRLRRLYGGFGDTFWAGFLRRKHNRRWWNGDQQSIVGDSGWMNFVLRYNQIPSVEFLPFIY